MLTFFTHVSISFSAEISLQNLRLSETIETGFISLLVPRSYRISGNVWGESDLTLRHLTLRDLTMRDLTMHAGSKKPKCESVL